MQVLLYNQEYNKQTAFHQLEHTHSSTITKKLLESQQNDICVIVNCRNFYQVNITLGLLCD